MPLGGGMNSLIHGPRVAVVLAWNQSITSPCVNTWSFSFSSISSVAPSIFVRCVVPVGEVV